MEELLMVEYRETLDRYLHIAGNRIGSKLSLDKNGLCILRKEDGQREYVVELPKHSEVVYFYSPICRVPYGCSEEFFEKVLELNLCGITYNQATFGLDVKTQNIVLSYTRPLEALDEVAFSNILCNFIKTADRAEKDLVKLKGSLIEQTSLTEDDVNTEMSTYRTLANKGKLKV
ncbi:MAG: CesT family type III secretion system chaperone [Puniceicoccales bacterium]|jgi:hypothetical protein|nr:CesT family type III secretion system chaperone [Puniceicoccales bacterium]